MKKISKPLSLNKETVRQIGNEQLELVAGGYDITNNPNMSMCVCPTKPGRCRSVGGDFCD